MITDNTPEFYKSISKSKALVDEERVGEFLIENPSIREMVEEVEEIAGLLGVEWLVR